MNGDSILSGLGALAKNLVPFVVGTLSVLLGLWLIFSALKAVRQMGERNSDPSAGTLTWGRVAGQALIGALLLQYARTMQELSQTLFASPIQDASAVMAYFPAAQGMGRWTEVITVALLWVVALGWCFGLRGLLQWNRALAGGGSAGQNGDLMWAGFWHLIGGAAMVNMAGFIKAFLG